MRAFAIFALAWCAMSVTGCQFAKWFFDSPERAPSGYTSESQTREDNPSIHPKMLMPSVKESQAQLKRERKALNNP